MARICVVEDNNQDIVSRYSFLAETEHEVSVVMDDGPLKGFGFMKDSIRDELAEIGFEPSRVIFGLDNIPESDIYLCDGLKGKCTQIADRFGKDKTFIYSDNIGLMKQVESEGYQVVEDVRTLVEKLE